MLGTHSRTTRRSSFGGVSLFLTLLGALVGMAGLSFLIVSGNFRIAIAATISLLLIALSVVNIRTAIIGTLIYLVFMGDIRRMLIPSMGWSGEDPLLLIGPVFALVVFAYAWSAQVIKLDTPLAAWISVLMGVMMLQMFNPRQGGLIVGVAGALFYLIPVVWYWIGRTYATPAYLYQVLFYVVVPLAGLAGAFALYQTFYGFLPYQELWIEVAAGSHLLGAEGIEKPFSFFASPTEHDNFILTALAILLAALIHRRKYGLLIFIIPLIAVIFLGGSRGPVAKLIVTTAGLWAVMGTNMSTWIMRGLFALVIGVVGLSWAASSVDIGGANERVEYRLERQREGFSGESQNKSALNHLRMMGHGFKSGITAPLGLGLGATTKAAAKYGGSGGSTEGDASDLFLSTGLVGGVIYLIIMYLIIRTAFQYWANTRSLLALCLGGVLAINIFLWLKGGQYAMSSLIWFLIGALDRLHNESSSSELSSASTSDYQLEADNSASGSPSQLSPQLS